MSGLFWWRDTHGPVELGFTSRRGGVSSAAWNGLNLAGHVGDDDRDVRANRELVCAAMGLPPGALATMDQVHGTRVAPVDGPGAAGECDAMVSTRAGLALMVMVADCVPVLAYDPSARVLGVAHAGRAGMAEGVVPALLDAMARHGAVRIHAVVGPSICARCYEVPAELAGQVAAGHPEALSRSAGGTPSLDVAAGVLADLAGRCESIRTVPGCTREEPGLYSYRRDGQTGRFAGVVLLRNEV